RTCPFPAAHGTVMLPAGGEGKESFMKDNSLLQATPRNVGFAFRSQHFRRCIHSLSSPASPSRGVVVSGTLCGFQDYFPLLVWALPRPYPLQELIMSGQNLHMCVILTLVSAKAMGLVKCLKTSGL
uniref:Uncharacterized protein n=1 Tax=Gopherus evgoodei TaxID=1825980 RepID=A0A8C4XX26_9SAUR